MLSLVGFNKEKSLLIIGLLLAAFFMITSMGSLLEIWGPILSSQNLSAPKITTPVALDFPLHWTASFLALTGKAATVYDYPRFTAIEKNLTGGGPHPWPYPPQALLIDLPLALSPYFISLAIWLTLTLGAYLVVLYCIAPHPLIIFWALAFFGTFINFYFGQNGFLSTALLGGGLLLLESSPLLAGMLLGLLSYKPHIFVLIPLALLLSRKWLALGGAFISGLGLLLASIGAFGPDIWLVFLKNIPHTINNLHTEALWFDKMPSVFAAVRFAGYGLTLAWVCQGLMMFLALALMVWTWSGPASAPVRAAGLVVAILLFSPHIWHYDLTLLALPLAWFWQWGCTRGWLGGHWEPLLLIFSFILPVFNFIFIPGPVYLIPPVSLLVHRHLRERAQNPQSLLTGVIP